jgi:hypothetical protein
MRTLAAVLLALGLTTACKDKNVSPREVQPSELSSHDDDEDEGQPGPGQAMSAAGVELHVPESWTILDESEAGFAMASGPASDEAHVPVCTIELRRQGAGPLPKGVKQAASSEAGAIDYSRGVALRGRLREFPGPSESASVVAHCRSPRSAQWGAIDAAFDSLKVVGEPELPGPVSGKEPIVELCTGTPARRTYACVRRRDGAVFCGPSTGEALTRVEGLPAAAQLSCEGSRACIRDAEGKLSCWEAGEAEPEVLAKLGKTRDIAGGCVVDEGGKPLCRRRDIDGSTTEVLAELVPFDEDEGALRGVEQVLAGSNKEWGCVLGEGGLRCWDRTGELPLALAGEGQLQAVEIPEGARDLARIGERVCVAVGEAWTCLAGDERWTVEGCERRPCGCTLVGATRISCEHEPHHRIDTRPLGRVANVVAVDGACAALADGTVVCRGPVTGKREEPAALDGVVVGAPAGVLHVLALEE